MGRQYNYCVSNLCCSRCRPSTLNNIHRPLPAVPPALAVHGLSQMPRAGLSRKETCRDASASLSVACFPNPSNAITSLHFTTKAQCMLEVFTSRFLILPRLFEPTLRMQASEHPVLENKMVTKTMFGRL